MEKNIKGILCMIISAMTFALMQIAIALTADTVPLFEQLFFRNFIAAFIAFFGVKKLKLKPFGEKKNRKLLLARSITGYLGMVTTFYAAANASQGDVAIINKMSPFIITILAFIFLKEKITKYQVAGLVCAFIGAYFVANPEFNSNVFPIFVAFLSAIFTGIAYTLLSSLNGKEHPTVVIFFFSLVSTLFTIPLMLMNFVFVSFSDLILLILIGVFAALGQVFVTYAYNFSKAGEVSIYNYSGIIFSMIFGYIFLEESVKSTSAIGAILVIISGIIVYYGSKKDKI